MAGTADPGRSHHGLKVGAATGASSRTEITCGAAISEHSRKPLLTKPNGTMHIHIQFALDITDLRTNHA